jgi:hypothetical protein
MLFLVSFGCHLRAGSCDEALLVVVVVFCKRELNKNKKKFFIALQLASIEAGFPLCGASPPKPSQAAIGLSSNCRPRALNITSQTRRGMEGAAVRNNLCV